MTSMQEVEKDFKDDKYIKEEGFYLYKADLDHIVELGRVVIPILANGFNTHGVVGLFVLAYNLRAPYTEGHEEVFEDIPTEYGIYDVAGDTVVNIQYSGEPRTSMCGPSQNPIGEAIFYCYVAASMLRLFTKSVDNYINAWTNITNRFISFYGFSAPLPILPPTTEAIRGLHSAFSCDDRMKMTLYKILYSAKKGRYEGLRRFLYEMHLANTGLHAVDIFTQLCVSLNIKTRKLLQVLYTPEFEKQTNALVEMTRMMTNDGQEYAKRMWRFGRIFDKNFMSSLQTKACPEFVYILASMIKAEEPAKCKNILKIVQLSSLNKETKLKCGGVGYILLCKIKAIHRAEQNPLYMPLYI